MNYIAVNSARAVVTRDDYTMAFKCFRPRLPLNTSAMQANSFYYREQAMLLHTHTHLTSGFPESNCLCIVSSMTDMMALASMAGTAVTNISSTRTTGTNLSVKLILENLAKRNIGL